MTDDAFDPAVALTELRETLAEATIPSWRHGQAQFMNQPQHVLARPRGARLSMVVAVTSTAAQALEITRLREYVPIYASFLHTIALPNAGGTPLTGHHVLRCWAASWERLSSRWTWAGWNPDARSPERADDASGRTESWEVVPDPNSAVWDTTSASREIAVPRQSARHTVEDEWESVDDGTGLHRRLRDTGRAAVADFAREEDARFVIVARRLLPTLGGAVEQVLAHCAHVGDGPVDHRDLTSLIRNAPSWSPPPDGPAEHPQTRR